MLKRFRIRRAMKKMGYELIYSSKFYMVFVGQLYILVEIYGKEIIVNPYNDETEMFLDLAEVPDPNIVMSVMRWFKRRK